MKVVDFEIVSVELSEAKNYKLVFQAGRIQTEVIPASANPKFKQNKFQYPCDNYTEGQPNFDVTVISADDDGVEQIEASDAVELGVSKFIREFEISFKKHKGHGIQGTIKFFYKFCKLTLSDSLKKETVACLSMSAAHLNNLVESPFELKLLVNAPDFPEMLVGTAKLTNTSSSAYVDVSPEVALYQLIVTDPSQANTFYAVDVIAGSPIVVPIAQTVGDPIVLTVQLVMGNSMVTSMFHSSAMRDAEVVVDPTSNERKVSLSPRRTTSWDMSAAAAGLIGTGKAIPSSKKTLIYIEDTVICPTPAYNHSIIAGVRQAALLNDQGEPLPASSAMIINEHEVLLTGRVPAEGPMGGAYIVCNSKSELLENEKRKKSHKRQLHGINLGLLRVAPEAVTKPLRIRASLVDLQFERVEEEVEDTSGASTDNGDDAGAGVGDGSLAKVVKFKQKAILAFQGMIEETSRELFNETGLMACTLEGKLFKPNQAGGLNQASAIVAAAAAAVAAVEGDGAPAAQVPDAGESCVAVKLYCSLVPSAKIETEEEDAVPVIESVEVLKEGADESGSESAAHDGTAGHGQVSRPASGGSKVSQPASSKPSPIAPSASPPPSKPNTPPPRVAPEDVGHSIEYSVVDKEVLQFQEKQRRQQEEEAARAKKLEERFNVVTAEDAAPDGELVGSSTLSVPNAKLSREDLKARSGEGEPSKNASKHPGATNSENGRDEEQHSRHSRHSEASADSMIRRIVSGVEEAVGAGDHFSVGQSVNTVDSPALHELRRVSVGPTIPSESESMDAEVGEGQGLLLQSQSDKLSIMTPMPPVHEEERPSPESLNEPAPATTKKKTAVAQGAFGEGLDGAAVRKGRGGAAAPAASAAATASTAFAEVVRAELNEKQRLIEKLMEEVNSRTEAIQVVGRDIRGLREEKIRLQAKIKKFEEEKEQKLEDEAKAASLTQEVLKSSHTLAELDRETLVRCANKLREQLNGSTAEKLALQQAMIGAKGAITQFAELRKEHQKLQEAHQEQSRYLRKMQQKIDKIETYKSTIQTQEKVISKMQRIIETKLRSNKGDNPILALANESSSAVALVPPPKSGRSSTSAASSKPPISPHVEKMVSEAKLSEAKEQITALQDKVNTLEQELYDAKLNSYVNKGKKKKKTAKRRGSGSGSDSDDSDDEDGSDVDDISDRGGNKKSRMTDVRAANIKIDELEAENTSKDYRISALESQLESSTRDYSREIARLRTKLFELEISASMGLEDDDNSDDETAGRTPLDDDARLRKLLGLPEPRPEPSPPLSKDKDKTSPEPPKPDPEVAEPEPEDEDKANAEAGAGAGKAPGHISMKSLPSVSSISMSRPQTQLAGGLDEVDELDADVPTGSARSAAHALKSSDTAELEKLAASGKRGSQDAQDRDHYPYGGLRTTASIESNIDNIPTPSVLASPAQSVDTEMVTASQKSGSTKVADIAGMLGTVVEELGGIKGSQQQPPHEPQSGGYSDELQAELLKDMNSLDGRSERVRDDSSLKAAPSKFPPPSDQCNPTAGLVKEEEVHAARDINEADGMSQRMQEEAAEKAAAEAAAKAAADAEAKKLQASNAVDGRSERVRDDAVAAEEERKAVQETMAKKAAAEAAAAEEARRHQPMDKVVQMTIDIKHADATSLKVARKHGDKLQLHPSTMNLKALLEAEKAKEATRQQEKIHKMYCGKVSLTLHYKYDPEAGESTFDIRKLHLSDISPDEVEPRFHPYLHLRFTTSSWSCKTNPLENKGLVAEWVFDNKGFSEFDKQFKASDEMLEDDGELLIFMKKLNSKGHEDFLVGFSSIDLNEVRDWPTARPTEEA